MHTILVACEQHEGVTSVLETSLIVAKQFDSYLEGIAAFSGYGEIVAMAPAGAAPVLVETVNDMQELADARERFVNLMKSRDIPQGGPVLARSTYDWLINEPINGAAFANYARIFDCTVMGRPVAGKPRPRIGMLEALLFDSGGPVLIAPPTPPTTIGETIVIAWNGSAETTRTIAFAMPFLAKAKRVVVLTVDDGTLQGPSGQRLASHLSKRGLPVEALTVPQGHESAGSMILQKTAELGGDLLIKGAYTKSRLRQMIFGGATNHILWSAEVPVLMAH
ncbi:MAG: universal stress protein [Hyphomicrobiaceae bacterium]